jgi:S1-C subfamily serine protease
MVGTERASVDVAPREQGGRVRLLRVVVRRLGPLALLLLAALGGAVLYNTLYPPPEVPNQQDIESSVSAAMASATPPAPFSSRVYQTILPSLVLIRTQGNPEDVEGGFGVGSGVVVNTSGDILTALHVVTGAAQIEVYFTDGSQTVADIISAEPENDIAVLMPYQPPGLIVPAVLGNAGAMRVGDEAYAVGNPLGLAASLSAGVISGFDRSITLEDGEAQLEGLIQFDTAVNPGNSGGPLLNRYGHVVGIVTALANPSEQDFFTGIGFAVPIGTALSAGGGGPGY